MPAKKSLEIACFNLESAIIAQSAGADRLELCANYKEGGLTPSFELIKEVRKKIQLSVHVIIRPQSGNFVYSENELISMRDAILFCKVQGIEGVTFGILKENKTIDLIASKLLCDAAQPMSVTFHRAIDTCENLEVAFTDLLALGIRCVLTAGGKGNAADNISTLKELQSKFGNKIKIMPGGGIRSSNLPELLKSKCTEIHSSAITSLKELADAEEIKFLKMLLMGRQ